MVSNSLRQQSVSEYNRSCLPSLEGKNIMSGHFSILQASVSQTCLKLRKYGPHYPFLKENPMTERLNPANQKMIRKLVAKRVVQYLKAGNRRASSTSFRQKKCKSIIVYPVMRQVFQAGSNSGTQISQPLLMRRKESYLQKPMVGQILRWLPTIPSLICILTCSQLVK